MLRTATALLLFGFCILCIAEKVDDVHHKARLAKAAQKESEKSSLPLFSFEAKDYCKRSQKVVKQKDLAIRKILGIIRTIEGDEKLGDEEREFQVCDITKNV